MLLSVNNNLTMNNLQALGIARTAESDNKIIKCFVDKGIFGEVFKNGKLLNSNYIFHFFSLFPTLN